VNLPKVCVMIITYDRPKEIRQTISALEKYLVYPKDLLHWHIADDNSPDYYVKKIKDDFKHLRFTATVTDRKGWGANVNKGIVHCHGTSDYIFVIEDDYVAQKEVNLIKGVCLIGSEKDTPIPEGGSPREPIGMVRYDGLAAHNLLLELREAKTQIGNLAYFNILKQSIHLNCYSNRPHLRHRRFLSDYGEYKVGLSLGATETAMAMRFKHTKGGSWITALSDGVPKGFDHIGKSRQGTNLDPNKGKT